MLCPDPPGQPSRSSGCRREEPAVRGPDRVNTSDSLISVWVKFRPSRKPWEISLLPPLPAPVQVGEERVGLQGPRGAGDRSWVPGRGWCADPAPTGKFKKGRRELQRSRRPWRDWDGAAPDPELGRVLGIKLVPPAMGLLTQGNEEEGGGQSKAWESTWEIQEGKKTKLAITA